MNSKDIRVFKGNTVRIMCAVQDINPDAQIAVSNNDVDTVEWLEGTTPISKEDILARQAELQTQWNNYAYARNREKEYPAIADQLDDIYHNGVDGWKATIKVTKDKYPKP